MCGLGTLSAESLSTHVCEFMCPMCTWAWAFICFVGEIEHGDVRVGEPHVPIGVS